MWPSPTTLRAGRCPTFQQVLPTSQASQTLLARHTAPSGSEIQGPPRARRSARPGPHPARPSPWHRVSHSASRGRSRRSERTSQTGKWRQASQPLWLRQAPPVLACKTLVSVAPRPVPSPQFISCARRTGPRRAMEGCKEEGAGIGLGEGPELEGKGKLPEWPGVPSAISEEPDAGFGAQSAMQESQGRATRGSQGVSVLVSTVFFSVRSLHPRTSIQPRRGRTGPLRCRRGGSRPSKVQALLQGHLKVAVRAEGRLQGSFLCSSEVRHQTPHQWGTWSQTRTRRDSCCFL